MSDWNPDLYRQFEAERTRPARELVARIPAIDVSRATDLGCGPGNSTELLWRAWPQAKITGLDSSLSMLEQAKKRLPDCHFMPADIRSWQATAPQDVIFANASLQWLDQHQQLLPQLVTQLAPYGVLAIQMPDNLDEPSHRLMRDVAARTEWQQKISSHVADRKKLLTAQQYYDVLSQAGCRVDIWRTTYYHLMPDAAAIIDWLKATGLRPFLASLNEKEQQTFLQHYLTEIRQAYLPQTDGNVLLAFPRLFIVAQQR
ncbi:trans-aconitate 2-methyltransferase [Winslowiella iniecta]|uniref:Trans-aconitate 2-methyltransferase n=1 Tax=Winslowiella iniecta TaxID=1560201 RepID=A0A0L7TCC3_9GAMM|nr:trans-aconitate 2-methyltransferase [Winslowiella iniecta]KOC89174.1 trans-aconitate methyltransferase [Winslowiella iniecta]KOC93017.1 trans-aconitate methyltransferase [Winslowiella iniecta]